MRSNWLLAALLVVPAAWGQAEATFRDRKAWRLENDKLRVTVLKGGGHIAELVLKNPPGGREINPLWVPPWPSIEPSTYDREKHGKIYGADSEAATLAGIMGHNVCFDYWGAPSPSEFDAGLSYHGEVSTLEWKQTSSRPGEFTYRADLPQSRTSLTRTLRVRPGQPVLYFEETAENHTALDRPFGWVQHVTFGPPFLSAANSFFDAPGTQAERRSGGQVSGFLWPQATGKDFRRFPDAGSSADMAFVLLDPKLSLAYIAAINTEHRLLVAYLFPREDFPWLNVWEQNRSRTTPPWNGETQTRGMEFGNTRISGTLRAYLAMPVLWQTPTFGWLDAKTPITVRYLALVAAIPAGFNRVSDIGISGQEIVISGASGQAPIRVGIDRSLF